MGIIKCETIFFDLGGVLLNFSHDKMVANIAKYCHLKEEIVRREFSEGGLGEKYESGIVTSKYLHEHFCKLSSKKLDYDRFLRAGADIFSEKTEVSALLPFLKKNGIKLIVLSNTCQAHFSWIQSHYSFLKYFDELILSYEVKVTKPDQKIYLLALEKANTPIQACFYVDDILQNISAAQKIGIDSHLFQGVEHLIQALQKRGCSI